MTISIITINYNNAKGLRNTIESVLSQNSKDYEYIIIDGDSTDGSKDVIEEYKDRIDYWVSEQDKGIYNAMNKGIAKAKGKYCLFLNSGDVLFNENVLSSVVGIMSETDYDYYSGNSFWYNSKGKCWLVDAPQKLDAAFMYHKSLCHQSVFTRTDILKKKGYDEKFKIVADWIQMFQTLILNDATYYYLPLVISYISAEGFSLSHVDLYHKERAEGLDFLISKRLQETIFQLEQSEKRKIIERSKINPIINKRMAKIERCFLIGGKSGSLKLMRNSVKWWLYDIFHT